jgi:hypothetical protein
MFAVFCNSEVLRLREPNHIVCFIINILIPGLGTVLSAFPCIQDKQDYKGDKVVITKV